MLFNYFELKQQTRVNAVSPDLVRVNVRLTAAVREEGMSQYDATRSIERAAVPVSEPGEEDLNIWRIALGEGQRACILPHLPHTALQS